MFDFTFLFPCLNEAETIESCIHEVKKLADEQGYKVEILVADNGSSDASKDLAKALGARVIDVPEKGYGAALRAGIEAAHGYYIIMADADGSYMVEDAAAMYQALKADKDMVIGNRFARGVDEGAMPLLHYWVGNPVLSMLGRALFASKVKDWHCGLRGVKKDAFMHLGCRASGMEFASEMIARGHMAKLKIGQVPTGLRKDGRSGAPHLRPFRDGLRHVWVLIKLRLTGLGKV